LVDAFICYEQKCKVALFFGQPCTVHRNGNGKGSSYWYVSIGSRADTVATSCWCCSAVKSI